MADGVDTAGHAAGDDEPARSEVAAEALRHLRAVESGLSGADNAEAGEVEDLGVTANVEKDWRIVDLQERLRVCGFRPVDEAAAVDVAGGNEFLFSALEGFLFEDRLRNGSGKAAAFEFGKRGAEDGVRRAETFEEASGQTRSEAGRERQREPREGGIQLHRETSLCA
jgi:hypothetical protein